jgi:hypothetical protein
MTTAKASAPRPILMVVFGAFILWGFGHGTVWPRLTLAVDGTVTARTDTPSRGAPRFVSAYTLRSPGGTEFTYVAGATDAALARGESVGTVIQKRKWQLGYTLNGKWMAFPVLFYGVALSIGAAMFVYGASRLVASRR